MSVAKQTLHNLGWGPLNDYHCIRRTHEGHTLYYHPVVEAKLALENGLALSVGTAFVENLTPGASKQDCETKGFYRLAKDLKGDFPMLDICLLLDGLFANRPVIKLCKHNRWAYIITFKEGSLPAVWQEYQALKGLTPENVLVVKRPGCRQTFRWVNDIDFDGLTVNAFECLEETAQGVTPFVWLTGFRVTAANVVELSGRGGRLRWKIGLMPEIYEGSLSRSEASAHGARRSNGPEARKETCRQRRATALERIGALTRRGFRFAKTSETTLIRGPRVNGQEKPDHR